MMDDKVNQNELDLAEVSILGNILLDDTGEVILSVTQHLSVDDFSDARNREIFRSFIQIQNKGRTVDMASVVDELTNSKMLDSVGGIDYLNALIDNTVRIAPVSTYISTVKDKALLNRFLERIKDIDYEAKNKPIKDISEFIGKSADSIIEIAQQRSVAEAHSMDQITDDLMAKLVKQTEEFKKNGIQPNGVTGVSTGYAKLDKYTKGWHKGDMIVVGARPSVGKTAFALNLLYQVAKKGKPVVFFSLEMSAEQIALRLLNLVASLDSNQINSLEYLPNSTKKQVLVNTNGDREKIAIVQKLQRGLDELASLPIYVDDNPGSKMMDISTKCKKLQNQIREIKKKDIGLIAIDYIGLISSGSKSNSDNRQNEVAEISKSIKQMARTLDIPVIALTQLSRDSEKRTNHTPQISDIRESGAIEQDADMILMLYREDYYTKQQQIGENKDNEESKEEDNDNSKVNVMLIKNRNGQCGTVRFIFAKNYCSFNVAQDENDLDD